MKKLIFAFLAFVAVSANAQTAEEVVSKFTTAMGGLDKYNQAKTVKISGSFSSQGNDFPITIQMVNGKAMRTDVDVMGQTISSAYKDGKGWRVNPFAPDPSAVDVTGPDLNDMKTQTFFASQLMDYKARNFKIELQGQETVEGIKTNKIKLTADDNKVTTYYIDAATSGMVKSVTTRNVNGTNVEVETYYSDLKEFNGIKYYMSRMQKVDGQVTQEVHFDKIEFDVAIDDKIFNKE